MNSKVVLADLSFLLSRGSKLILDTRILDEKGWTVISFVFYYDTDEVEEDGNRLLCVLRFIVQIKAKVKNKILFKIELEMEGMFTGNNDRLSREKFMEMLEINGLVNLLHLSRAYLISVTAQSGINPPVRLPMINVLILREEKANLSRDE